MTQTLTTTISATSSSALFGVKRGEKYSYAAVVAEGETFDGQVLLQFTPDGGQTRVTVATISGAGSGSIEQDRDGAYLFACTAFEEGSDNIVCSFSSVADVLQDWQAKDGVKPLTVKEDGIETPKATVTTLTATNLSVTTLDIQNDVFLAQGDGVPVDYTDGDPPATGEAVMGIGSLYIDRTNGKLYINGGTKAQPIWKIVTSAT